MTYSISLELIELEAFNYHLAAPCMFENGRVGLWIIDTGASRTVFDQGLTDCYEPVEMDDEMVRSAGIGSEKLETTIGELQAFTFDHYEVEPMLVALIDLSHINSLYFHATEREICGLIGSDFLMMRNAIIDYSTLQLTLQIPSASEEMGQKS